jgi:lipoprotein-anchoring transpeptidase ErfK/SrfK
VLRPAPAATGAGIIALALALALAVAGCGRAFDDPLAGWDEPSGPTVLVEIQTQPSTVVATATVPEVIARAEPSDEGAVLAAFANPVATGGPLVFQVVEAGQDQWLEVLLPIRPNGTTGWIPAGTVELSQNPYRIEIDVAGHQLEVLRRGDVVLSTVVGIGTGATPTPIGSFYVTELLRPPDPGGPYGPYAFGLSGFSETLTSFNGGEGVIGLHGTDDPSSLGHDVSHGCVRVANATIEEMASLLPLGTPVVIS